MAIYQDSKTQQTMQPRQIAYVVQIKDILNSVFVKEDGLNPNYVKIGNKNVSRINIIGAVIDSKEEENFQNITIGDGTGEISVRNFEKIINIKIGDAILLIGRVRQFGNSRYVTPEIIKRNINAKWSIVWRKNAIKNIGIIKNDEEEEKDELTEIPQQNNTNDIISKIKDLDDGSGVSYDDVIKTPADEKLIANMLLRGDVFEIKPGKLKVLD